MSDGEAAEVAPPATGWRRGARALRDAFAGAPRDWTQGPIAPSLLLLALPMVVEMSMESLFALVDIFWISRLAPAVAEPAVAVVGTTESLLSILYALAMGIGGATAAIVARRVGEKRREKAAEAAVQEIAVALAIALLLGVAGGLGSRWLLAQMGMPQATIDAAGGYATVMFGGNATVVLLFVMNAIFRGAGDAAIAMRVLLLANSINLVLDPCLLFGWGPFPEMGVAGAAVATNIGRGVGVLYQLSQLVRHGARCEVFRRHLRLVPDVLRTLARLAGTGTLQSLIQTTSWVGLLKVLNQFGDAAVAGYTFGIRVVIFGLLPSWGLASAAATMVGQSLGAKDPARAAKSVWLAGSWNLAVLSVVGAFFALATPWIVGFFTDEPDVAAHAIAALRTISYGFPFFAFGMVFAQAFNGAGDPWTPTWINFGAFWCFELPLATLLANQAGLGPSGVFWAIGAAFSLFTVVAALLFRRGKWQAKVV